jgi:hypothetical protein
MAFNPELVEERPAHLTTEELAEGSIRVAVRPSQQVDSDEAVFADEVGGRSVTDRLAAVFGLDPCNERLEVVRMPLGRADDCDLASAVLAHGLTIPQPPGNQKSDPVDRPRSGEVYCASGGAAMPSFPRFLFRVKDRQIEEEARKMVDSFGIKDIEIRRDDTIKDAWLEDNVALKTTFGLEDIQEYLENVTNR